MMDTSVTLNNQGKNSSSPNGGALYTEILGLNCIRGKEFKPKIHQKNAAASAALGTETTSTRVSIPSSQDYFLNSQDYFLKNLPFPIKVSPKPFISPEPFPHRNLDEINGKSTLVNFQQNSLPPLSSAPPLFSAKAQFISPPTTPYFDEMAAGYDFIHRKQQPITFTPHGKPSPRPAIHAHQPNKPSVSRNSTQQDCAISYPWTQRMSAPQKLYFVVERMLTGASGDERLILDLAYNLSRHFGVGHEFCTVQDCDADDKTLQNPNALFVLINPAHPQLYRRNWLSRNVLSVGIQNDLNCDAVCDVVFDPFFNPFPYAIRSNAQLAYDINLLPSRFRRELSAGATTAINSPQEATPEVSTNVPKPIVAIMIRSSDTDTLSRMVDICKKLDEKGVKFLVSTGPASEGEATIEKAFSVLTDVEIYCWHKQRGKQNPYLSMIKRADYLVTSGTLSTTSDLLHSGKPVFYMPPSDHARQWLEAVSRTRVNNEPLSSEDSIFIVKLITDGVVKLFDDGILDGTEPEADIKTRESYTTAWDRLGAQFAIDVLVRLQAFSASCECVRSGPYGSRIPDSQVREAAVVAL